MMKRAPSLRRVWLWIAAVLCLLLTLAACLPAAPTAAPTLPAPSTTFSPSPSPLPTLTPSPAGRGTYAPPRHTPIRLRPFSRTSSMFMLGAQKLSARP